MIIPDGSEASSTRESVPPLSPATELDADEIEKLEAVKPVDEPDEEDYSPPPPIVEQRLLVSIDALRCLRRLSRLAQQTNNIPQCSTLFRFACMTSQFTRAIEGHLRAVTTVLPAKATDLEAPDVQERA